MNQRKMLPGISFWCVMVAASTICMAQSRKNAPGASTDSQGTRYFQLTLVLKYPESAQALPEPGDQSITTEVAVNENRPGSGSCKTRMTSQLPMITSDKTRFIELGTKFDCDNIHVEGNALALSIILETSRVSGFVTTKNSSGVETEEPLVTQQNIALSVKLPLDTPKIVFDSNAGMAGKLKPLKPLQIGNNAHPSEVGRMSSSAIQVEMTAHELK